MKKRKAIFFRGFTIVEMIIYCAILVVFLTVLTAIFSSLIEMQLETEATAATAQDSKYIFSRLAYDITRASAITTPATLGGQTSTLGLTIGATANTYAISGGNLELTNANGTDRLNSVGTTVTGATFSRYGNATGKQSIRVTLTVASTTVRVSGPEIQTFETTIALR